MSAFRRRRNFDDDVDRDGYVALCVITGAPLEPVAGHDTIAYYALEDFGGSGVLLAWDRVAP